MKFYTEEGNWDLVAINTPIFSVRDLKNGPDNVHAFKRDPRTNQWNGTAYWDYVANHPESLHAVLMTFTDRYLTCVDLLIKQIWNSQKLSRHGLVWMPYF